MSKKNLGLCFFKMLNLEKDHDVDLSFDVGNFEDFTLESFYSFPYILVSSGRIYVTEPIASVVHSFGVSIFTIGLLKSMSKFNKNIFPMNKILLFVKNVFYGSAVFRRQVDFTLSFTGHETPLIGEVAFRNEEMEKLLEKCTLYLTEYVNCNYVIGMKISAKERFEVEIFLLEKIDKKFDSNKCENLKNEFFSQINYKKEDNVDLYPKEKLMIDYKNGDLSDFNAKILLKANRTQEDLSQIEFSLDSRHIYQDETKIGQILNVNISTKDLQDLLDCWNKQMEEDKLDQD